MSLAAEGGGLLLLPLASFIRSSSSGFFRRNGFKMQEQRTRSKTDENIRQKSYRKSSNRWDCRCCLGNRRRRLLLRLSYSVNVDHPYDNVDQHRCDNLGSSHTPEDRDRRQRTLDRLLRRILRYGCDPGSREAELDSTTNPCNSGLQRSGIECHFCVPELLQPGIQVILLLRRLLRDLLQDSVCNTWSYVR